VVRAVTGTCGETVEYREDELGTTLADVAARAGVSVATASRALSGKPGVSASTRFAVQEASRELEYQPSAIAASLRKRSTGVLGLLVPDITNPFFPAIMQGLEREFAKQDKAVVLMDTEERVEVEAARVDALLRRRVDALIVSPVHPTQSADALRRARRHVRVIQIDRRTLDDADFVGVDHAWAITKVIEHLQHSGARSAAFVGFVEGNLPIVERAAAYRIACETYGIECSAPIAAERADLPWGHAAIRRLLAEGSLPDAIICGNDLIAAGAITELREAGFSCPQDVLLTGYDDAAPIAEILGLTTVRQPLSDLGREAARLLRQKSEAPRTVMLTPAVIVRSTSARHLDGPRDDVGLLVGAR
jgi:LacI family transcriptional regulator